MGLQLAVPASHYSSILPFISKSLELCNKPVYVTALAESQGEGKKEKTAFSTALVN